MPRKSKKVVKEASGSLESVVEELNLPNSVEVEEPTPEEEKPAKKGSEEVEVKREELMKLAVSGEIPKTPAQISRASVKMINKLYDSWEAARMERANCFLCDMLISKFSAILGGFDAVEKPEELERDLINDPLLREDIEKVVCLITPWIPFLGILSGGITVGKHVFDHKATKIGDAFAKGPFEKPPGDRTEKENKNGYDTVN